MKTFWMVLLFPALLLAQSDTLSFLRVGLDQENEPGQIIAMSITPWRTALDTTGWWGAKPITRLVLVGDVLSEPDSLGNREIWHDYKIQHQPGRVDTLNSVPCNLDSKQWRYREQLIAGEIKDKGLVDKSTMAADSVWKAER